MCFPPGKFDIHNQKSGSKPLFSLFRINLEKYMETIQSFVSHKASLYSS